MNEILPILTDVSSEGIGSITLNRPQTHNAFDEVMIEALNEALKTMETHPQVKVLLLKSEGKNFSAGADLNWMKKMAQFSPQENLQDTRLLAQLLHRLAQFKKPTVAMVQGNTFGGGIGLIAACHIALCEKASSFTFSEAKLGLIPATITPYIINAIGHRNTRAYFLSGLPINAQQALAMGLVQELCEDATQLSERTQHWMRSLLQNGPLAIQTLNQFLTRFQAVPITPDLVEMTAEKLAALRSSKEGQEGINAFLEKRKPTWVL